MHEDVEVAAHGAVEILHHVALARLGIRVGVERLDQELAIVHYFHRQADHIGQSMKLKLPSGIVAGRHRHEDVGLMFFTVTAQPVLKRVGNDIVNFIPLLLQFLRVVTHGREEQHQPSPVIGHGAPPPSALHHHHPHRRALFLRPGQRRMRKNELIAENPDSVFGHRQFG